MPTLTSRFLLAAIPVLFACGDDSTGIELNDLTGTWVATRFDVAPVSSPSNVVDALDGGNVGLTLDIAANGSYTATITVSGTVDDMSNGTISLDGNTITLAEPGSSLSGTFTLMGDVLTVNLTSGLEFDFGSGDESATGTIELSRT